MPSAFSMTFAVLPSMTATHELVVPRSIPMTFPMVLISFFLRQVGWALTAHLTEPPTFKYSRYCDGEPSYRRGGRACKDRTQPCGLKRLMFGRLCQPKTGSRPAQNQPKARIGSGKVRGRVRPSSRVNGSAGRGARRGGPGTCGERKGGGTEGLLPCCKDIKTAKSEFD